MSEHLLLPTQDIAHFTEFVRSQDGKKILNGDCVEYAMIFALACVLGRAPSPTELAALVASMQSTGVAQANGATSINNAHDYLVRQGYAIEAYVPYSEPFNGDWRALITKYKGKNAMVLNIARAGNFPGDEPGVDYHGIAFIGDDPDNPDVVICADGDNRDAPTQYQRYTFEDLAAARPCGLIVLKMQGVPTMQVPPGWHWDGVTLTPPTPSPIDRAVHAVAHELNQFVLTWPGGWAADNYPLESTQDDETANGVVTRFHQTFAYVQVRATRADAHSPWQPFLGNIGVDLLDAAAAIANLRDQLAHPLKNPAPAPSPDENAALKAALTDIVNRAQAALK